MQVAVLATVARLGKAGYGVTITDEVSKREGREVAYGSVHVILSRLVDGGLVKATMGEPTAERGGRRKRYYEVTGAGQSALQHAWSHSNDTFAGLSWLPKPVEA
jgi:DNA-binding PadR family transcriptional regulator